MSDIPSTGPDNSAVLQQIKTPSHYEQKVGPEYGNPCHEVGKVILKVKDKNIIIITNPEKYSELQNTKQQTEALSEGFKQEFINKLKKTSSREDILKAIENGTLKIIEIPGDNNLYGLSIKSDLDYIYDLEGKMYVNMVRNLDDEYLKYYSLDLEYIGYSVSIKGGNITFIDLKTKQKYTKSNNKFYEIIIKSEKFNRKIMKGLKDELDKRGVKY